MNRSRGTAERMAEEAEYPYRQEADAKARAWCARARVYFVRFKSGDPTEPIKIGVTANMRARMRVLQTASAYPIEVLATIVGDDNVEHRLHRKFAADRLNGEWFRPSEALIAYIASLTTEPR